MFHHLAKHHSIPDFIKFLEKKHQTIFGKITVSSVNLLFLKRN